MLQISIFFILASLQFVVSISQIEQPTTMEHELFHRQHHYVQQFKEHLQKNVEFGENPRMLDQLQQFAMYQLMQKILHILDLQRVTRFFLRTQKQHVNLGEIVQTENQEKPIEEQYISADVLHHQISKFVNKRQQPKEHPRFQNSSDSLFVDKKTKTKYLRDKVYKFLQEIAVQNQQPQNGNERLQQQKIIAKIRELIHQNKLAAQQQKPPLREVEDILTKETEPPEISQDGDHNKQQLKLVEIEVHQEKEKLYNLPPERGFKENSHGRPQQNLFLKLQNPKRMENLDNQLEQEKLNPEPKGKYENSWLHEYQELQNVLRQLQKTLEKQNEKSHTESHFVSKEEIGQTEPNMGQNQLRHPAEWFYPPPTTPSPTQFKLNTQQANFNVLGIVKSQDLSQNQHTQQTTRQMPTMNEHFWGNLNNLGHATQTMMRQIAHNVHQRPYDFSFMQAMQSTMLPPLANAQILNYSNNDEPPALGMMQAGFAVQQQSNNFNGHANVPAVSGSNTTRPTCSNGEACTNMSANKNKTTDMVDIDEAKGKSRGQMYVTPVSIAIAIIQNLLVLDVWENIKLSNTAIEEAERYLFSISANINLIGALTDSVLFLRRRLEFYPNQFGDKFAIMAQIKNKISRMTSLKYETARAISSTKVDLSGRRKEALTYKPRQLPNGLINVIVFAMNLSQLFPEEESLTEGAMLFQGVVTAVFAGLIIANIVIFFLLGGYIFAFNEILESVTELELQFESLTSHFHDVIDRLDFAFETPAIGNTGFGNPGSDKGPEKGPDKSPDKGLDKVPGNVPDKGPDNGPDKVPGNVPDKGPDNGPDKGPDNGPDKGPGKGTGNNPDKGPGTGPDNGPDKGSDKGSEKYPGNGPDKGPGNGVGNGPDKGSDKGPDKAQDKDNNKGNGKDKEKPSKDSTGSSQSPQLMHAPPGYIENIEFSNSGAVTGTFNVGGFNFGSGRMDSKPAVTSVLRHKIPTNINSSQTKTISLRISPVLKTSPGLQLNDHPRTLITHLLVTTASGVKIIKKNPTQNGNFVNDLTR